MLEDTQEEPLRKALDVPDRIYFSGGRYAFDHTISHSFDVADFEEKTRQARQCAEDDPETAATLLGEAAELYCGDFLEGLELGATPPPELTALIERLRGGEELQPAFLTLPSDFFSNLLESTPVSAILFDSHSDSHSVLC